MKKVRLAKYFIIPFCITCMLLASGCASSSKASGELDADGNEQSVPHKETREERRARLERERLLAKQKKDPYTGWVYIDENNPVVEKGDVKVSLKTNTGSFGLYVLPEQGREIPLLSTYESFCSTFFSVKVGRQEYRLNRENGVKCESRRTAYGAQMVYTINNKAQVTVDFSLFPSIPTSTRVDMIRVTVYVTNLGRSMQSFAIKGVFDTVLGENAYTHFSTAAHSRIDNERQYSDMSSEKWIRSSNENAAIQFIFDGKGITKPQAVTLGSKDLLSSVSWVPSIQESRGFTSVHTYNNSALSVNYPAVYLDPERTEAFTFYISVAADGNEPAGREFIAALESGNIALSATPPSFAQTSSVAANPANVEDYELTTFYRSGMPVIDDGEDHSQDVQSNAGAEDSSEKAPSTESKGTVTATFTNSEPSGDDEIVVAKPVTKPVQSVPEDEEESVPVSVQPQTVPQETVQNVQEEVSVATPAPVPQDYQLDPEYIQTLLDRIAELEENPSLASPGEIDRLNRELDSILAKLRSLR